MHIQEDRHAASASGETKFTGRDRSPGFVKQGSDVSFDLFAEIFQAIATTPVPSSDSAVGSSGADASQDVDASRPAGEADGERDDEVAREEPTADSVAPYDMLTPLQPVVSEEPVPVADVDAPAVAEAALTDASQAVANTSLPTQPSADVDASLPDAAAAQIDQQPQDGEPLPTEAPVAVSTETEPAALDDGQPTETEIVVSELSSRRINSAKPASENLQQAAPEHEQAAASGDKPVANEHAAMAEALPPVDHRDSSRDQGDRRQRRSNLDLRNDKPNQAAALQERQDEMAQRSAASMSADTRAVASEPGIVTEQLAPSPGDPASRAASTASASAVAGLPTTAVAQQAPATGTALGNGGSVAVGGPTQAHAGQADSVARTESNRQTQVADRARLVHRIAKAFQRIGVDGGQVRLKMHPEELGGVQLSMQISGRKVSATVTADGEAARQLLQDHLPELRQRLESLGLTVERLDVTSRTEGGETGFANQNQHQNGTDFGRSAEQREGLWRRQNALNDVKRETLVGGAVRSNPARSFRSDRALDLKV